MDMLSALKSVYTPKRKRKPRLDNFLFSADSRMLVKSPEANGVKRLETWAIGEGAVSIQARPHTTGGASVRSKRTRLQLEMDVVDGSIPR